MRARKALALALNALKFRMFANSSLGTELHRDRLFWIGAGAVPQNCNGDVAESNIASWSDATSARSTTAEELLFVGRDG